MAKVIEGQYSAQGLKVGIVASRFNDFIVSKLVDGALDAITRHGGDAGAASVVWVPGSFEIAGVARKLVESGKFDAVICLGCIIKGGTDHYEFIASEAAKGIAQIANQSSIPVIFGVLTTHSIEQAVERAGTKMGNKGAEAAIAAMEMATLYKSLDAQL